jgi:hypothetical protein
LKFFDLHYAEHADRAKGGIQCIFNKSVEDWPDTPEATPPPNSSQPSREHFDHFDIFTAEISSGNSAKIRAAELNRYLKVIDPILPGQCELAWWKVCFIFLFVVSFSIRTDLDDSYRSTTNSSRSLLHFLAITCQSRPPLVALNALSRLHQLSLYLDEVL